MPEIVISPEYTALQKEKIDFLHRKMLYLFSDIYKIKKTFPFSFEEFLEDSEKVKKGKMN